MPVNTKYTSYTEEAQESIDEISPTLKLDIPDDDLVRDINKLVSESENKREDLNKVGKDNENYWKADQIDPVRLQDWQSKIVDNRLFMSVETVIPIMTSRTPEPTLRLGDGDLRENTKQFLMNLWEVPNDDVASPGMQEIFEMVSRHWMIYRIGVLKYYYDAEIDDMVSTYVHPNKMVFDNKARNFKESRFVGEYVDDTLKEMEDKFPAEKIKALKELLGKEGGEMTKINYLEFWTPEYVVYKFKEIILDKKKNPNWDYGDLGGGQFNLFKAPRIPYLALNVFNLGNGVYDDTSLMDQAKKLQDGVNKRKNQINDNANDNGVLIGSGEYIDKKVLEGYTGSPREKLWLKKGNPSDAIARLAPKQMAAHVYQDLQDSKSEIDNMFGAHSTTRGERGQQKTLGEARLLKQGDLGRIDLLSRALDRLAEDWYASMLHMNLVFKDKPKKVNSNDEDGTEIIFDRNEYLDEQGQLKSIIIKVKAGSAMSIDKDVRRAEAVELAAQGLIDPITFYERMDYANPREMAMQLLLWQTNPMSLFPELIAQQQLRESEAQAQQEETTSNVPLPEGTIINLPGGEQAPPA